MIGNKPVVDEENLQKILDGSGLGSDLSLLDGDVISIPIGSANVVFVTGKVEHPGTLPLKPGSKLSAYAAILDSGGFPVRRSQEDLHPSRLARRDQGQNPRQYHCHPAWPRRRSPPRGQRYRHRPREILQLLDWIFHIRPARSPGEGLLDRRLIGRQGLLEGEHVDSGSSRA